MTKPWELTDEEIFKMTHGIPVDSIITKQNMPLPRSTEPERAIATAAVQKYREWAREHPGDILSKSVIKRVNAQTWQPDPATLYYLSSQVEPNPLSDAEIQDKVSALLTQECSKLKRGERTNPHLAVAKHFLAMGQQQGYAKGLQERKR